MAQNLTGYSGGASLPATPPAFAPATPDANVATFYAYDGLGRTTLVTQTGILTGTFTPITRQFSSATSRTTLTEYDSLSRPVTVTLNYQPGVLAGPDVNVQTLTQYDAAGNVIGQRDGFGRWTVMDYDVLNRPVTLTVNYENGDPLSIDSANTSWATLTDTDLIQVTAYRPDGQVDSTIENYVDGIFTPAEPDRDRKTVYQYDALGRPTTTIRNYVDGDPNTGAPDTDIIQTTAYDAIGRVQGHQDTLGRWVSQQYDALNRVSATIQNCRNASGTAVASGCAAFNPNVPDRNVPSTTHYDALGRAFERVDALGYITRTTYDLLGRAVTMTRNYVAGGPADSDTNIATSQSYDALNRVLSQTDPLGVTTSQTYDSLGRAVTQTDGSGRLSRMGYDGSSAQRWRETPDGRFTVLLVDGLGRVTTRIENYQDGVVGGSEPVDRDLITRTVYDVAGRWVASIDPAGRVTAFTYALNDQLLSVTENAASGSCPAAPCNVTTSYAYDRAGNRLSITDANTHTRNFAYDAADRQVAETDALGQTTGYTYDRQGRMTLKDDPRGSAYDVTSSYDELDRPVGIAATQLDGPISMVYNALGWRTSLIDGTGTTSFSHDDLGRITGLSAPNTGSVGYQYNARGERTRLTYPNSTVLNYTYFNDGQMQQTLQGSTVLASYAYDSAGRPQTITRQNGAVTTYTFDQIDRLKELHTKTGTTTRGRFIYTLDRLGQRTAVSETLGSTTRSVSYSYDGLNRLTGATESGATSNSYSYGYDLAGNRTSVTLNGATTTTSYNAANQIADAGYSYDAAGNLVSGPNGLTATYDALNRSTNATDATTTRASRYNGDGVLVETTLNGTTNRYAQDLAAPLSQVLRVTQGSSGGTVLWGRERLATVAGSLRFWEVADGLGSARVQLTDFGSVATTVSYDPWGKPYSALSTPFGFSGELQEAASGIVYLRARWYDATRGRFHQRDPLAGFAERPYSLHAYQYAYANPVLYTDPSGRAPECASRGICGPEATDWFANEVAKHMAYGQQVGRSLEVMNWRQLLGTACTYQELTQGLPPFDQIVQEWGVSDKGLDWFADEVSDLKLVEFALYGLAVNYANQNPDPGVGLDYRGNGQCATCQLSNGHPTVTMCGKCLDTSDLGNIMFGVGGWARGWSLGMVFGAASMYNAMTKESPLNEDPRGAIVGYSIAGSATASPGPSAMCTNMRDLGFINYNDSADETKECALCTTESMPIDQVAASSLYYRSDGSSEGPSPTVRELNGRVLGLIQDFVEKNGRSLLRPNPVP